MEETQPIKPVDNRRPDGTFGPGNTANPAGRPPGQTMKEYQAEKFRKMTGQEKEKWLKKHKVSADLIWRMSEGNPQSDVTSKGEKIIPTPILGGVTTANEIHSDNGVAQNPSAPQAS